MGFAIITTSCFCAIAACQSTQPSASGSASAPTSKPTSAATSSAPSAGDPVIDKILDRLENREIQDLRAKVKWELFYPIEEETTTRMGELWYRQDNPVAKFKAHFTSKIQGERKDTLDEQHMFDGHWYIELNSEGKTLTRREVRSANDKSNPYKLGEGAFPLPFGQRKADILREFEVERGEAEKDAPPGTDHLRLVPKPRTRLADRFATIDFWIAQDGKASGLPIRVRYGQLSGNGDLNSFVTVTFDDPQINVGLSSSIFEIRKPEGFTEIVEPLDADIAPGAIDKPFGSKKAESGE